MRASDAGVCCVAAVFVAARRAAVADGLAAVGFAAVALAGVLAVAALVVVFVVVFVAVAARAGVRGAVRRCGLAAAQRSEQLRATIRKALRRFIKPSGERKSSARFGESAARPRTLRRRVAGGVFWAGKWNAERVIRRRRARKVSARPLRTRGGR
jgi:hypothetical protein